MAEKQHQHTKRKLRTKIGEIIIQLRRRHALDQQQEKARKTLVSQRGPGQSTLGDHTLLALGLYGGAGEPERRPGQGVSSPRRTHILDALSPEELDTLRQDPWFFFTGPAFPSVDKDGKEVDPETEVEALVDFFTPARGKEDMAIETFHAQLRKQIADQALADNDDDDAATSGGSSLTRTSLRALQTTQERMPCQGRKGTLPGEPSPTLAKVKEAQTRRDVAETQWLDELTGLITRRQAANTFKAREQQRERQLQQMQQKETHKLRLSEASTKKRAMDAEAADRATTLAAHKDQAADEAECRAIEAVELRRDRLTDQLDAWAQGVDRCARYQRYQESRLRADVGRSLQQKMERREAFGATRMNPGENQMQKNDKLKVRIQASLHAQMRQQNDEYRDEVQDKQDAKLEAAAHRRHARSRYNFLERSFGTEAFDFDAKLHSSPKPEKRGDIHATWLGSPDVSAPKARSQSEPRLARAA